MEQDAYSFLNLTPHEFYEYTPNEYNNMMKGYYIKREVHLKDIQCQAWFNANFVGMILGGNELPNLDKLMELSSMSKETKQVNKVNIDNDRELINLALSNGFKVPQYIVNKVLD